MHPTYLTHMSQNELGKLIQLISQIFGLC